MMGLVDYHMHTILSDGKNTHEEMALAAIEKGLDEIGFTDHLCLKPVGWTMKSIDIPVMASQILDVKERYSKHINVRFGLEIDFFPGFENEIQKIIDSLPLDYVIGSIHFIDDWNFDTDKSLYGKWPNDELYEKYFSIVQDAARSGLFDIIGHIDIIKKFRVYPESNQDQLMEDTIKIIKENNLVVELNTGGMDRPCADFTPSPKLLEFCYRHHVPVTISSDAHRVEQIARYYESALSLLKRVGYTEIVGFNQRLRRTIKI
jgi:histidinol-phosphatase (PHP family)